MIPQTIGLLSDTMPINPPHPISPRPTPPGHRGRDRRRRLRRPRGNRPPGTAVGQPGDRWRSPAEHPGVPPRPGSPPRADTAAARSAGRTRRSARHRHSVRRPAPLRCRDHPARPPGHRAGPHHPGGVLRRPGQSQTGLPGGVGGRTDRRRAGTRTPCWRTPARGAGRAGRSRLRVRRRRDNGHRSDRYLFCAVAFGGPLVSGVTAHTDAVLAGHYRSLAGELVRLSVEPAAPIGSFTGRTPSRAVPPRWSITKGTEEEAP